MPVTLGIPTSIVKTNLCLHLDAADANSYPGSGTVWYDISGNAQHFNVNASAYNSGGAKYFDFNGSYGCAKRSPDTTFYNTDITAIVWTRVKNSTAEWRTLFRALSTGGDHQVIIQSGGWEIGMYDNTNGTGFNSTGFSQQSLPGNGTSTWVMMTWRWSNGAAPYYRLSYNDTPSVTRGTNASSNARFKNGICSIGAYNNADASNVNNASQYWGDIGAVMMYNRYLTDAEVLQNYNYYASRFGATPAQGLSYDTGGIQTSAKSDKGAIVSITTFTSSGTYTVPAGCSKVLVQLVGGGGGSAGYCESGGAGGYAEGFYSVSPGATYSVTVGGGGGGVGYYAAAGDGGTTSFGSLISASGGYGANRNYSHGGGHSGSGSGGQINLSGGTGTGHANGGSHSQAGAGGGSFFGGPGGQYRSTTPSNFSPSPGTGATGGRGNDGGSGTGGAGGLCIVYAYK